MGVSISEYRHLAKISSFAQTIFMEQHCPRGGAELNKKNKKSCPLEITGSEWGGRQESRRFNAGATSPAEQERGTGQDEKSMIFNRMIWKGCLGRWPLGGIPKQVKQVKCSKQKEQQVQREQEST
jgi:hypothetical protein